MKAARDQSYKKRWQELIDYYGSRCYYCRKEIATTIDHVAPYSWDQDNAIDNLVPACALCNALASNKIFESIEHKRQYILGERKKRNNQRAICTQCLLPFTYRTHSPSMFLCAECYDKEYGTKNAKTKEWKRWLWQLRSAGIPAEAHRELRRKMEKVSNRDHDAKVELLIDEYAQVVATDEEFAYMLMYS